MSSNETGHENRLDELADRLTQIENRLSTLETASAVVRAPVSRASVRTAPREPTAPEALVAHGHEALPLLGRTLVVLGGAFALRAITDAGIVQQGVGVALGLFYSIVWIVLAGRAGDDRPMGALFHGVSGAMIAFPLLIETTVRFRLLSPLSAVVLLAIITTLGIAVAARRRLRGLAWIFTVGSAATALLLLVTTRDLMPFTGFLLILGLATLWLGYARRWRGTGWFAAVIVDAVVLLMTVMLLYGQSERVAEILRAPELTAIQLALVVLYLGSFVMRAIRQGRDLRVAEIAQGIAVLLIGLGGSAAVVQTGDAPGVALATISLLIAIACYAASFTLIDRGSTGRATFVFYTTAALVCTLVGVGMLQDAGWLAVTLAVVALTAGVIGASRSRATLGMHGAVYLLAAAISSGLVTRSIDAMQGATLPPRGWIDFPNLIVFAVAVVYCALPVTTEGKTWGRLAHSAKLLVLALAMLGSAGFVVSLVGQSLPQTTDGHPDRQMLAMLRTVVLSSSAVLLAWAGRRPRLHEAGWLVYPVLVLGGLELVFEDLRVGGPITLLVAFSVYGGAMILAPRLLRHHG